MHDRDLPRRTAETQRRDTQPGLESLVQRDTVLWLPSFGDRQLSQGRPRCWSEFSSRRAFEGKVLSAFLPEVLVEVVEHFGTACKALRVIAGRGANAFHQRSDTRDFGPPELAILEVDVVNDLGNGAKRGILEAASIEQHLERAFVTLVGEFRLEHVETQFAFLRAVAFAGDEFEAGFRVDEAAYQPSAGDAVDVDALARDPGPVVKGFRRPCRGLSRVFASFVGVLVQSSL